MATTLTEGRKAVQLTDQREETNDLSTQAMGGKPPTYNQRMEEAVANPPKAGRSRGETDQRKEEAEGKMRNLEKMINKIK